MALNLIRIYNVGTEPFVGKYVNEKTVILPGESEIVEFEAMARWLGNPALVDVNDRQRDRTDEFTRLRAMYGVYEHDREWDERRPKLEAYKLDGTRVVTVADDPYNEQGASVNLSNDNDRDMMKLLLDMQKENAEIKAMLAGRQVVTVNDPEPVAQTPPQDTSAVVASQDDTGSQVFPGNTTGQPPREAAIPTSEPSGPSPLTQTAPPAMTPPLPDPEDESGPPADVPPPTKVGPRVSSNVS
jgi:hypothetical protein